MNLTPRGMSILEVYRLFRDKKLIVNRSYQRKLVWTMEEKRELISSILRGYPIPLILLAEETKEKEKYEIIDGIQRLNAIFSFIENDFYIGEKKYFDYTQHPSAKNLVDKKEFEIIRELGATQLNIDDSSNFLEYQLPITIYVSDNEEDVIEIFRRINAYGKHLSPQEMRQAGSLSSFSKIVRSLGSELRGDVSKEILPLVEMPEISVDSKKTPMRYGIFAEDTFWVSQGILNSSQLRDSEDEQLIADIVLSIALGYPFPASKEKFDKYYGVVGNTESDQIESKLNQYGLENISSDIKLVYSSIKDLVESSLEGETLKQVLNPSAGGNPVKEPFYTLFLAFYDIMIKENKELVEEREIIKSIRGLAQKITRGTHYNTTEDRTKNVNLCKGLIRDFFKVRTEGFRNLGTLSVDFENHLRKSKIESTDYEFKQGFLRLDKERSFDDGVVDKILGD